MQKLFLILVFVLSSCASVFDAPHVPYGPTVKAFDPKMCARGADACTLADGTIYTKDNIYLYQHEVTCHREHKCEHGPWPRSQPLEIAHKASSYTVSPQSHPCAHLDNRWDGPMICHGSFGDYIIPGR